LLQTEQTNSIPPPGEIAAVAGLEKVQ